MKFLFTLLIGFFCASIGIAEEVFAPFKSEKGNEAAREFKKSYDSVYEKFDKSMATSRTFASKQGNIEEIKKIQATLDGDFSQEFETPTAKSALNSFKSNVQRLCRDYVSDLKTALKAELSAGNVDAAEELQPTIEKLEASSKISKKTIENVRVEAEKNWQVSEIEVKKGDNVTISCSGTWTPGRKNPKKNPDTYNMEIKTGESRSIKSGVKKEFQAPASGKMSFRMLQSLKGKVIRSPEGTLTVRITIEPVSSFQEIYNIALDIGKKKEKKERLKKVKTEVVADKPDKKKLSKKDRKKIRKKRLEDKEKNDFVPPPSE